MTPFESLNLKASKIITIKYSESYLLTIYTFKKVVFLRSIWITLTELIPMELDMF